MSKLRIHHDTYQNWLRCSYGGLKTTNALDVSCKHCLRRIWGYRTLKSYAGRPLKSPQGRTIKRSLTFTPEADSKLKELANGRSLSDCINALILQQP